jgi:hypothetical protein
MNKKCKFDNNGFLIGHDAVNDKPDYITIFPDKWVPNDVFDELGFPKYVTENRYDDEILYFKTAEPAPSDSTIDKIRKEWVQTQIRDKYSVDDEFKIHRIKEIDPTVFEEYKSVVETIIIKSKILFSSGKTVQELKEGYAKKSDEVLDE